MHIPSITSEVPVKGPPFRLSVIILLTGLAIVLPGLVYLGLTYWSLTYGATTHDVPGTFAMHLDEAEQYVLYERALSQKRFGVVSVPQFHDPGIDRDDVSAVSLDGNSVVMRPVDPDDSIPTATVRYWDGTRWTEHTAN